MNVERLYLDNGFSTLAAMVLAHAGLISYHNTLNIERVRSILDLGCGNGILLKKLVAMHPGATGFGIDLIPERIELARTLTENNPDCFQIGSIFDVNEHFVTRNFDLTLLMVGRLVDADTAEKARLITFLQRSGGKVLGYVYDDWLARGMTVPRIARDFGLIIEQESERSDMALISL